MNPSWDLFIVLTFVIMGIYGFLLGRARVLSILVNIYVGLVVSTQLGSYAFEYLTRITDISHSFTMSLFGAKVFVFATILFVMTLNKELSNSSDKSAKTVETAIYGILAGGLMLSSIFSFMGDTERASLFVNSQLAIQVYDLQLIWLVAPVVMMTVLMVWHKFRK